MADLAQLGIVINVSDQNAAQKLTALSTAADKATVSVDKLEQSSKKASESISKVGSKRATDALNQTKKATDAVRKGYSQLLGDINKLDRAFAEVGKTQKGIKDLQTNLNAIGREAKKAYEAGKLSVEGYNRLGEASDKLALRLKEQKTALDSLNSEHYEAQKVAAQDLQMKQKQIAMAKLHAKALQENAAFDKKRQEEYKQAIETNKRLVAKEAQTRAEEAAALKKVIQSRYANAKAIDDTSRSYTLADQAAQKYHKTMREQEAITKAIAKQKAKEAQAIKDNMALVKAEEFALKKRTAALRADILARHANSKQMKELSADYAYHDREAQKYNRQLRIQGENLNRLQEAFNKVITRVKQFTAFIAAAAIVQLFTQAVRGAISIIIDFDQALKSLQAIAGATALEASVMGDTIRQIAADTKFSAQEVATGMQTIGKAGFSAGEALKMIQGVSNLATGALEEFNTVASLVVTAIRAFGLEVVQTGEITDIFANAITKSKLNVDSLVTAFGYVGAAGAQAGLTLSEVSGSLMVLADNGIRASTMGTAFRKTLLSMIAPNKALRESLQEVGLAIEDINPGIVGYETALRNIAPLVWDFERATVDMAKAKEFFGIRASQVAAILIRETAEGGGISRAIESTRELGAALRMAEKQQEGLGVKFKNLVDSVKNVALAMGDAGLTNVLHNVVDMLKATTLAAERFIKAFPAVQLVGYVSAVAGISAAFYGLYKALKFVVPMVLAFNKAMLSNPVGIAITAIAGAITAYTYFKNKIDDTTEAFKRNSIVIDENVSTIDGWIRTLENAKTKGIEAYNSALVRFTFENKELAKEVVNIVNKHDMLNGAMASSIEQVTTLAGSFDEYVTVVEKALKVLSFEKATESLDSFTEAFKTNLAELKSQAEQQANSDIMKLQMYGPFTDKNIQETQQKAQELKDAININLEDINDLINEFSRKLVDTAEKSGNQEEFIKQYTEQFKDMPEVLDAILKQVEAVIESRSKSTGEVLRNYSTVVNDHLKEHYRKLYASLTEFQEKANQTIQEYFDEVVLTPYEKEKKKADAHYKEMLVLAGSNKVNIRKVEEAYQKILAKLWKEEIERRTKVNDEIVAAKEKQVQELIELEISLMGNKDAINLTDKENRMRVQQELVDKTRKILKDRTDAETKASEERLKAEEEAAKKIEKQWERVYDDMHSFAADTFYDLFSGQLDSFENFADSMLDIFKRMLANMVAEAAMINIFKPLMSQMAGTAFGSIFGLPSVAGQAGSGIFGNMGSSLLGKGFNSVSNFMGFGSTAYGPAAGNAAYNAGIGYQGAIGQGFTGAPTGGVGATGGFGTMAATAGFWAAYAAIAAKLIGKMLEDNPRASFSGAESNWYTKRTTAGFDTGQGYTESFRNNWQPNEQSPAGYKYYSRVYDTGNDPEIQGMIFEYFDNLFGSVEKTFGVNMQKVLDEHKYFSTDLYSAGGNFQAMADSVAKELIPSLLMEIFPDAGTVMEEYKALTGHRASTVFEQMYPTEESRYLGKGEWRTPQSGRDARLDQSIETVMEPVYETITREVSALGKHLDEEFFKALAPEGGGIWEGFAVFTEIASQTEGFVKDLTRRIFELGQTAEDAFAQIQQANAIIADMELAYSEVMGTNSTAQIDTMAKTWEENIQVLRDLQVVTEQVTEAEKKRNIVMGAQLTGLTSGSLIQAILGGGRVEDILEGQVKESMAASLAEQIMETYIGPMNDAAWKIYQETEGNMEAVNAFLSTYDLSEVNALIDSFNDGFEDIFETLEEGLKDARDALDNAIRKEQQLIDARLNAADSINDLINDLMGGSMAPVQSLEFFEKRYDQLLAEARNAETADEINKAVGNLTNFVPTYLDFAGAYGGEDYNTLFNKITSDLRDIEYSQRTEAQMQLDRLDSINSVLETTSTSVLNIEEAFRQFLAARAAAGEGPQTLGELWTEVKALTPVGDMVDSLNANPLVQFGRNLLGFDGGGVSVGPTSGYPIIAHGTEAHVQTEGGAIPVQFNGGGSQTPIEVKIYMGTQEFHDFTVEVLENNENAHVAIRRAAG